MIRLSVPLLALILAACNGPSASTQQASPAVAEPGPRAPADGTAKPLPTDAWVGRWTGPEGLFLEIEPAGELGRYQLTIKGDLDSAGDRVTGMADGAAIRFERNGVMETLRAGRGADTELKWLADKQDCLIVKAGEGFCRG